MSPAGTGQDPAVLADLACSVAREAGDLLLTRHGRVRVVETKSSPTDVVTEMDRAAEDLIRRRILAARPGDAILGEEGGLAAGPGHGAVRWIVDPLDGTVNYLYGLPDWAVSIAAEVNGTVVAGAVWVPVRASLFLATAGGGAWLYSSGPHGIAITGDRVAAPRTPEPDGPGQNGVAGLAGPQRLACNAGVPLAAALVGTGFGYAAGRRVVQGRVVAALLPQVRDIRRGGSAAVDLCSVAAGRLDGFYERGLHDWDFAAGGLIAREAGAQVGGLDGRPPSESMTVAAGSGLFAALHDLLASLDPEHDEAPPAP